MKTTIVFLSVALALTVGVNQASSQTTTQRKGTATNIGKLDEKTSGSNVRISQLVGADIENAAGEDVGEVSDIVLESDGGQIRYAAVTYGGVMGIGDKLFAVPWEAFRCVQDPDDADEYNLVLDVTPEKLDGATGFDQETWPDFADKNFTGELDKRYGVMRNADGTVKPQK